MTKGPSDSLPRGLCAAAVVLVCLALSACSVPDVYNGPDPADGKTARVETRVYSSAAFDRRMMDVFLILSVDGQPWTIDGKPSGQVSGTVESGMRNIAFSYTAKSCRLTAGGVTAAVGGAVISGLLTGNPTTMDCAGREIYFTRKGTIKLNASAGKSYVLTGERRGARLFVAVFEKVTRARVTPWHRFSFPVRPR